MLLQVSQIKVKSFEAPRASKSDCRRQKIQTMAVSVMIIFLKFLGSFSVFRYSLKPITETRIQKRTEIVKKARIGLVEVKKEIIK